MKKIVIIGKNSQLAKVFFDVVKNCKTNTYIFTDRNQLDLTSKQQLCHFFSENKIDIVINFAAYNQVDMAEKEPLKALEINYLGIKNLIEACKIHHTTCIHFSTDFVFNGKKKTPYTENDTPLPLSVYGKSKLLGDIALLNSEIPYFILRVSWLYSEHQNNFLTKILNSVKIKKEISVVTDQIGTPTSATDVAFFIKEVIDNEWYTKKGIYNFSNNGECSRFEFAKKIISFLKENYSIIPCKTTDFSTIAQRPSYSALNKNKLESTFQYKIPNWETSLEKTILKIASK